MVTAREDGPGFVYLVRAGRHVKIGHATSPSQRLDRVQCGNPLPLTTLCLIPGSRRTETRLHHAFAPLRQRGEWYAYGPTLREFVRGVKAAGDAAPEWVYRWLRQNGHEPAPDAPKSASRVRAPRTPKQVDLCRETGHFPAMLCVDSAALYLGLPVQEVRARLRDSLLPGWKIGNLWRLSKAALDEKAAKDNAKPRGNGRK